MMDNKLCDLIEADLSATVQKSRPPFKKSIGHGLRVQITWSSHEFKRFDFSGAHGATLTACECFTTGCKRTAAPAAR